MPQRVLSKQPIFENFSAWVGTKPANMRYFVWRSKIVSIADIETPELVLIGMDKTELKLAFDQLAFNEHLLRIQNDELIEGNIKFNETNDLLTEEKERVIENEKRKTEFIKVFSNRVLEHIDITNSLFEILHQNYNIPETEIRAKEGELIHADLRKMLDDYAKNKRNR
ncbi:MAG TPA: hypothetical protein DCQ31_03515 [Bacteroidales bacterium]|nr:hypothetical protein [Bacteroidales bacterium]